MTANVRMINSFSSLLFFVLAFSSNQERHRLPLNRLKFMIRYDFALDTFRCVHKYDLGPFVKDGNTIMKGCCH